MSGFKSGALIVLFCVAELFCQTSPFANTSNTSPNAEMHVATKRYQTGSTMNSLTLPASSEVYMLGMTGSARYTNDPMAATITAAQLGMQSMYNTLSGSYSFFAPYKHYLNHHSSSYSMNASFQVPFLYSKDMPLTMGVGYTNYFNQWQYVNYSVDPNVADITILSPTDEVKSYSIGLGLNTKIKLAAGFTNKTISSEYYSTEEKKLYDFGVLAIFPIHELFTGVYQALEPPRSIFSPFTNIIIGYNRNNFGSDATNSVDISPNWGNHDTLVSLLSVPVMVQTGFSVELGLRYNRGKSNWQPLKIGWTIEESDILSYMGSDNTMKMQGILGDINLFNDILLGKTNSSTVKHKALRIDLCEAFSFMSGFTGSHYNPGETERISGWQVNTKGMHKTLKTLLPSVRLPDALEYIFQHLNLQYCAGTAKASYNSSQISSTPGATEKRNFYSININVVWSN
ncbi:MAG: hypothetical protein HYV28_07095 [Ignavibacteriales bacterium]|nr:hypothetical protein [Ignavibacteriales bacterium]